MGTVELSADFDSKHHHLVELLAGAVEPLGASASVLASSADLPDIRIAVRITDDFVAEMETNRDPARSPYSTDRLGGGVAGVARQDGTDPNSHRILLNAAAFAQEDSWGIVHLPNVLAHEIAHCLIGQCRAAAGAPSGYCETPENPIQVTGFIALAVCDEYLADGLAKALLPPFPVPVPMGDSVLDATDRLIMGTDRLARMIDDLDNGVYPKLRNRVEQYQFTGQGLGEMTQELIGGIQGALIMSAHYRAAVSELPQMDEVEAVAKHPASQLYLDPFWELVGPHLDARLAGLPLSEFPQADQAVFDLASGAVMAFWSALGIDLELVEGERVYVHVSDPIDV